MANVIGVGAMFVVLFGAYLVFKNVIAVALGTTIILTIWTFVAEMYLNRGDERKQVIKQTIAQLIETILEEHSNSNKITALVKKPHVKEFKELGFSTWLELKLYTKMDYKNLEKKQE